MRALHPRHVLHRPVGPSAHAPQPQRGQRPVPALPHHRRQGPALLQTVALLGVLLLGYCYFQLLVPDPGVRLQQLGLFCSFFTISMYLSPMADLAKIIQTQSTKCLSYPLTVATLLTSSAWTLYGLRLHDLYITVPNVPGIVTSLMRLWLFRRYPPTHDRAYRPLQA
uniref:Sugar transporter SWEET1 n=1 Tax=Ornithorhynchus anatinus TaxID=9258 RepID=A0A6I8N3T6_ORNAN